MSEILIQFFGEASLETKLIMETGTRCKLKLWYYLYTDQESESWPVLEIYKHSRPSGALADRSDEELQLLAKVSKLKSTEWEELDVQLNKSREFVLFIRARTSKDASVSNQCHIITTHSPLKRNYFYFFYDSLLLHWMTLHLRSAHGRERRHSVQETTSCAKMKQQVTQNALIPGKFATTRQTVMMDQMKPAAV